MRIFVIWFQSHKKHNIPGYQFWRNYWTNAITEAGHEWVEAPEIDWVEGLTFQGEMLSQWQERTWYEALKAIQHEHRIHHIDLCLSYLFPQQVLPTAIKEIQSLGIPCVNFFCDNVREFTKIPKEFYCFDLHWVPEYKALSLYREAQLNYIYAPMPVWVAPYQRTITDTENYGVTFIGSHDIQREILLSQVLSANVNLEIRGAGWLWLKDSLENMEPKKSEKNNITNTLRNQFHFIQNQGFKPWLRKLEMKLKPRISTCDFADFVKPSPNDTEYVKIIQESMITLGINRYPSYRYDLSQPNTYSRMRDIEAPMIGACYLTEWTEGLEDLYVLGKEIETYRNAEELVDKIRYLNSSPDVRKMLRTNGQKRALSDHSINKTLTRIFGLIK